MRPVSVDEFVRAPVGCYVALPSYLVWVYSPTLAGAAAFGRPDEREAPDFRRLTLLPDEWVGSKGLDVVLDGGELATMDGPMFAMLVAHLPDVLQRARKVRRVSIVRPSGMAGATLAGFFYIHVAMRIRSALFADRTEAFSWLGRRDTESARLALESAFAAARLTDTFLERVRDYLNEHPRASLASAARGLAISERSLSRRLAERGTSFRGELQRARLRLAETMLSRGGLGDRVGGGQTDRGYPQGAIATT